ncbi:uncharacterized protein LOC122058061 [Macadamia integrifolia]|uniref:uncharacterized protein LOC122058061 n=1 Tax=Macadamia integrifolia TaxID=60698 RepID=UPI001C533A9C|nr:uncharacterized protein LOC122058061 [Macadamia integrifolia]XP_042476422.1 uncharacterized protein LOC122058061 [Macadamia integrifolia]XP_042476423.1 uncharacterized protein LOC122058061 [Macadamia integrifolia]
MEEGFLTTEESLCKKGKEKAATLGLKRNQGGIKTRRKSTAREGQGLIENTVDQDVSDVIVSMFDYSVESHFRAIDMISRLCEEVVGEEALGKCEIKQWTAQVTFLREWRYFYYKPRIIRFNCETGSPHEENVVNRIKLPQFSSATVPKMASISGDSRSFQSTSPCDKDFVFYVGGSVWALDWCPRVCQSSDFNISCEYLAVAAHPPESSYHKIGAPLTGRGLIQIWCLLNVYEKEEGLPPLNKPRGRGRPRKDVAEESNPLRKPKGRPRKDVPKESNPLKKPRGRPRKEKVLEESTPLKKPRGRPRKEKVLEGSPPLMTLRSRPRKKKAIEDSEDIDSSNQFVPALDVIFPEDSAHFLSSSGVHTNKQAMLEGCDTDTVFGMASKSDAKTPQQKKRTRDKASLRSASDGVCQSSSNCNEDKELSVAVLQANNSSMQHALSSQNVPNDRSLEVTTTCLPKDVALPRLVLCLAHNGKVAWDVKWRPSGVCDLASKHRMGYLAVLLGNGSMEVWEVPSVSTIKVIYSSCNKEGTDPRFLRLEPVFRCSKLKFGDRQSIPLTVEWSPSSPHDLILAGCHDGTVALWKFSARHSCEDTRPLLCFSADTVPIRALAWAPIESDTESANVIITAGHGGLKFWDIRDPYHPLWDLSYVRRVVCSLDWLPDPNCVVLSLDDGTLRILSLLRAACDVSVTGKPFVGTQQQGLHSYCCSPFSIWSVQVSRLTGLVAYCSADGNVLHFQLTAKAVEKDPFRNRAPHFLCGSLTVENSVLTVHTPLPHSPFTMKKSPNEYGDAPRSIRGFMSLANQANRGHDQRVDYQNPALCYEDNSNVGIESENALADPSIIATKQKKIKKKKPDINQESIAEEELENLPRGGSEKGGMRSEIEVFPSKDVAMHIVRWNMNKGSERWLCYGGASGIVRCQKIDASCVPKIKGIKK